MYSFQHRKIYIHGFYFVHFSDIFVVFLTMESLCKFVVHSAILVYVFFLSIIKNRSLFFNSLVEFLKKYDEGQKTVLITENLELNVF